MTWFVHLPTDRPIHEVLPLLDPASQVTTFSTRPTKRAWAQYQDFYTGIGADHRAKGSTARDGDDVALIAAWLTGYRTTHLVVGHAMRLLAATREGLTEACEQAGTTLVLTEDDGEGESLANLVLEQGGEDRPYEDLREVLESAEGSEVVLEPEAEQRLPARLPMTDFYLWRHRCREVLEPDQFEAVDSLYRTTFDDFRNNPAEDPASTAERLASALAGKQPSATLTIVRAAQAATFVHGSLLKVDLNALLSSIEAEEFRRLNSPQMRSMSMYRHPWYAAAMTLFDAGLSPKEIGEVRPQDVNEDGHIEGVDTHPDGLPYLRAQRAITIADGRPCISPMADARGVRNALNQVATDLNFPLPAPLPVSARKADRWQHTLGITLIDLNKTAQA